MYDIRPSQIACTFTTMHKTCMQTALHVHGNLCMLLIRLCKNNLNLPSSHAEHHAKKEEPLLQSF